MCTQKLLRRRIIALGGRVDDSFFHSDYWIHPPHTIILPVASDEIILMKFFCLLSWHFIEVTECEHVFWCCETIKNFCWEGKWWQNTWGWFRFELHKNQTSDSIGRTYLKFLTQSLCKCANINIFQNIFKIKRHILIPP